MKGLIEYAKENVRIIVTEIRDSGRPWWSPTTWVKITRQTPPTSLAWAIPDGIIKTAKKAVENVKKAIEVVSKFMEKKDEETD